MSPRAAVTVDRGREEVERRWHSSEIPHPAIDAAGAQVTFKDAPGDRGTEIHVELGSRSGGGVIGKAAQKLTGAVPLAKVKDDLRHFKQLVETGVISRSDAVPEGERFERKLDPRPGQPLEEPALHEAGV